MGPAFMLAVAIGTEIVGTLALRYSDGFTRLGPSALAVVGWGASAVLLAQVVRHLPVGVVYAIWSAVGTAIVAVLGIGLLGEQGSPMRFAYLALVIAGVVGLSLSGARH
jgi:small multidrug resistance pump